MELSKYKVSWVIFEPKKGIVTKRDRKAFGSANISGTKSKYDFRWFANKTNAVEWIKSFDQKLDKEYSCRVITDAQFGKIKINSDGTIAVPYTEKQRKEVFTLK